MYQKVSTSLNFVEREKETLAFWKENKIFEKSVALRQGAEPYTFYDGPPTANGKPHIGHILTRAIKDIIPRYRTMKGYDVLRKAGWDTHGLPVELEVEKLLGLDGKEQIEQYGVEPFIQKCKESVWKYKAEWEQMSERVGFWADMENPYVTYETIILNPNGGRSRKSMKKGCSIRGTKSSLIARAAERRSPPTKSHRAIRMLRKPLPPCVSAARMRTLPTWPGPPRPGRFLPTCASASMQT